MTCRFLLTLLLAGVNFAQAAQSQPVEAKLLADVSTLKPGATFTLGVLLKIRSGWHVYWQNPGDSGSATTVQISSTPALQFQSVQYPVPAILNDPGDLIVYAYQDQVMLMVRATVLQSLKPGETVKINAKVNWLVCKETCIPGSTDLTIEIPVGVSKTAANEELFTQWFEKLPRPLKEPAIYSHPADKGRAFEVRFKEEHKQMRFVGVAPGPESAVVMKGVAYEAGRLKFVLQGLRGQKIESGRLPILLIYEESPGVRRGYSVEIPLKEMKGESL